MIAAFTPRFTGLLLLGILAAIGSRAASAQTQLLDDAVQISSGALHSCAVTTTGGVRCWGSGAAFGSVTDRRVAYAVTGLSSGVASVSAGGAHTCVVTTAGGAKCLGRDTSGQLGRNNADSSWFGPADVNGLTTGVSAIAAGGAHSCALMTTGTVKCWGLNDAGQLGNGTTARSLVPIDVPGLTGVTHLALGNKHSCALIAGGSVQCWGANNYGQLGDSTTTNRLSPVTVTGLTSGISALSTLSSGEHACALTMAGGVKCWGDWRNLTIFSLPLTSPANISGVTSDMVSISGTCGVTTGGAAKCWGSAVNGQLGNGVTNFVPIGAADVIGLSSGVSVTSAGRSHACALLTGGQVQCWGDNIFGMLGDDLQYNRLTPVDITGLTTGVLSIMAGGHMNCAITAGGAVCMGENGSGQLGDGTHLQRNSPVDVVSVGAGVQSLAVGWSSACAITSAGGVKCWGGNGYGELGDGTTTFRPTAADVTGLTSGVSAISMDSGHVCAVTSAGGVKCWGQNNFGQLGDGTTTQRNAPVNVSGLASGVVAIGTGIYHTCALTTAGGVKCWGEGSQGQLGNGSLQNRTTPTDVTGLSSGVAAISLGHYQSCALTTGGAVLCWGHYIGTGGAYSPTVIPGLEGGVTAVAVGDDFACALMTGGTVKCWGVNYYGFLGNGSQQDSNTPVTVSNLTGVAAITAGRWHACALTTAGGVKCWGQNYHGELGAGGVRERPYAGNVLRRISTSPEPFSFSSETNVPLNVVRTSFSRTIEGNEAPLPISVTNGLYSIGCTSTFVSTPSTIAAGQHVCLRHTTGSQKGVSVTTTLQVGDQTGSFTTTTAKPTLFASKTGAGSGALTLNGITDCGFSCTYAALNGEAVTLTVAPNAGSVFGGWTNCPSPNGTTCNVVMGGADLTVNAKFDLAPQRRADATGNGTSDIIWYHTGVFGVIGMNANGTALDPYFVIDVQSDAAWKIVGLGDLNGDGSADLVWYNTATGELYGLLLNGGAPMSEGRIHLEPNLDWKPEQIADVSGDRRADIVWKNQATGAVYVMLMNGLVQSGGQVVYTEPNLDWKIVASGDMNGDGRGDLLWRNIATGDVFAMLMNGLAVQSGGVIYTEPNLDWKIVGLADFNNDSRADVLWQNISTGDVFEMRMNGTTVSAGQVIYNEANTQWKIVALGDYNGDGRADVLWQNTVTGQVYMMLMDGFIISSADFVYTEPDTQWQIVGP